MMVQVSVVTGGNAPKVGRKLRSPRHTFSVRQHPWAIQPFFIAPVLPGETMKNLLVQAVVVTDPIKSRLVGWWYEQYYFYVKLRDLAGRDDFTEMMLKPDFDSSGMNTPATLTTYHGGGINYVQMCLERVVEEYFRNEDEAWDAAMIGGLPVASINTDSWLDSAKLESQVAPNSENVPGHDPDPVVPDGVPEGFEGHFEQWQNMRALQLTDATFEDYLKTFGVRAPKADRKEELHRPELIRYVKDWTYPVGTVVDGNAANGCVWKMSERADKDRFFSEPGFLFGVSVCRPKVYLSRLMGSATSFMNDAYTWLPAVLADQAYTSLRRVEDGTPESGVLAGQDEAVWFDLKDLFVYGDQFVNYNIGGGEGSSVALPLSDLSRRYASMADVTALFSDAGKILIRSDGVVALSIAGRIVDTSLHGRGGGFSDGGTEPGGPAGGGGGGGGPEG